MMMYRNTSSNTMQINPVPPSPPASNDTGGSIDEAINDDDDDGSTHSILIMSRLRALSRHTRVFLNLSIVQNIDTGAE